jgi:energy-converting hydrogenase Eha subunit H
MRSLGRSLQIFALAITPVAIFLPKPEVFRFPGPEFSLLISMFCLFQIGRYLEGYSRA